MPTGGECLGNLLAGPRTGWWGSSFLWGNWRQPRQSSTWPPSGSPVGWGVKVEVQRDEVRLTERETMGSNKLSRVFFPPQIVVTILRATSLPFPTQSHLPESPLVEELLEKAAQIAPGLPRHALGLKP